MCKGCYMGKPDPKVVAEIEAQWDQEDVSSEECSDDNESCSDSE